MSCLIAESTEGGGGGGESQKAERRREKAGEDEEKRIVCCGERKGCGRFVFAWLLSCISLHETGGEVSRSFLLPRSLQLHERETEVGRGRSAAVHRKRESSPSFLVSVLASLSRSSYGRGRKAQKGREEEQQEDEREWRDMFLKLPPRRSGVSRGFFSFSFSASSP